MEENKKETALEEQLEFIDKEGILVNGLLVGQIIIA